MNKTEFIKRMSERMSLPAGEESSWETEPGQKF